MPTAPTAPGPWVISSYTNVRVAGKAKANSTGGATILQWQLAWGTSPNSAQFTGDLAADGSGFVTGLDPGVTYYFWNRQRNAYGWSDMSQRTSVRMRDVPDPPVNIFITSKTQTGVSLFAAPGWNGDSPILEYRWGYSKSPFGPGAVVSSGTSVTLHMFDLDAGDTYYFWVQARNEYGWSPWSGRATVQLIAGARVNVNGVWKRAVPYVRVGGVWKLARVWIKVNGEWKLNYD